MSIEDLMNRNEPSVFDYVVIDMAHQVPELDYPLIISKLKPQRLILLGDTQ